MTAHFNPRKLTFGLTWYAKYPRGLLIDIPMVTFILHPGLVAEKQRLKDLRPKLTPGNKAAFDIIENGHL